jgi:hypothetical protein
MSESESQEKAWPPIPNQVRVYYTGRIGAFDPTFTVDVEAQTTAKRYETIVFSELIVRTPSPIGEVHLYFEYDYGNPSKLKHDETREITLRYIEETLATVISHPIVTLFQGVITAFFAAMPDSCLAGRLRFQPGTEYWVQLFFEGSWEPASNLYAAQFGDWGGELDWPTTHEKLLHQLFCDTHYMEGIAEPTEFPPRCKGSDCACHQVPLRTEGTFEETEDTPTS